MPQLLRQLATGVCLSVCLSVSDGPRQPLHSPVEVVGPRGGQVLVHQTLHHLPRVVQLLQALGEHLLLPELLEERLPFAQLVVLLQRAREQRADGGVVGQHQTRDAVRRLDVGRLTGERHLDAGRAPRDELRQFTLTDPLQRLVHLSAPGRGDGSDGKLEERRHLTAVLLRHQSRKFKPK